MNTGTAVEAEAFMPRENSHGTYNEAAPLLLLLEHGELLEGVAVDVPLVQLKVTPPCCDVLTPGGISAATQAVTTEALSCAAM